MPHFTVILIPYINLLNLSWIIKCLFFEEYGTFKQLIKKNAVGELMLSVDLISYLVYRFMLDLYLL